ncbi:hypothetical protein AB8Z38_04525 [Bradyrhizobium sp. LLZ17]|uniref:Uncharacterized protein n=1 Tax=Bradyrhizobium sp. LLZ17 TaxID=3239388 RepID=A0AB39XNV5_9BRAD
MAEVNSITVQQKELVELLIKNAGVHEGKWMLLVNFGFGAMNGGPSPDQMMPTAVVALQSIGIQRAEEGAPPSMVVDAAQVNPSADGRESAGKEARAPKKPRTK